MKKSQQTLWGKKRERENNENHRNADYSLIFRVQNPARTDPPPHPASNSSSFRLRNPYGISSSITLAAPKWRITRPLQQIITDLVISIRRTTLPVSWTSISSHHSSITLRATSSPASIARPSWTNFGPAIGDVRLDRPTSIRTLRFEWGWLVCCCFIHHFDGIFLLLPFRCPAVRIGEVNALLRYIYTFIVPAAHRRQKDCTVTHLLEHGPRVLCVIIAMMMKGYSRLMTSLSLAAGALKKTFFSPSVIFFCTKIHSKSAAHFKMKTEFYVQSLKCKNNDSTF